MGALLRCAGEYDTAIEHLLTAVSALPTLGRAWFNLSRCFLARDDVYRARHALRKAMFLDGRDPQILAAHAGLDDDEGNLEKAAERYLSALANSSHSGYSQASRMRATYWLSAVVDNDLVPGFLAHYSRPYIDEAAIRQKVSDLKARRRVRLEKPRISNREEMKWTIIKKNPDLPAPN
jgi:tetratricopeptide (TPR) repeat protein